MHRVLTLSIVLIATRAMAEPPSRVDFDRPAQRFTESAPLGNGRLGAMVFGGVASERIVLNESSLWSGRELDQNRGGAWRDRERIVELLLEGQNPEAEELVNRTFTSDGPGSSHGAGKDGPFGCYQVLGELTLDFPGLEDVVPTDYARWLNLADAEAVTTFDFGDMTHRREVIVSHPDRVVACRNTVEEDPFDVVIGLSRPERGVVTVEDGDLIMSGRINDGQGGDGMGYVARVRVIAPGAVVHAPGGPDDRATPAAPALHVSGSREVIILVAARTSYDGPIRGDHAGAAFERQSVKDLERASSRSWSELVERHRRDFAALEARTTLDLGPAKPGTVQQRLAAIERGEPDPAMAALLFRFGRYLLISSSRPGGLPANLQGLWAGETQTPWNGDYHLNINVQMNYWLAETTGLPECHLPLFELIDALRAPGARTAAAYYGAPGWVAHVITNVWGFTAPGEHAAWGSTLTGGAWLCAHLWEHFLFTGDVEHLRRIYPILKESSAFYRSVLVELPERGWLVTGPSNSPENAFRMADGRVAHTCLGPTMDQQLLRERFGNTIRAAEILGVDEKDRAELAAVRDRLAPHQIAPHGRLQEWLEPYDEPEPHHCHVAHLYGLYPGNQIWLHGTPELASAARRTLEARGDTSTGWSMAWKACFWARLGDGDRAEALLRAALRPVMDEAFNNRVRSGSYPNLLRRPSSISDRQQLRRDRRDRGDARAESRGGPRRRTDDRAPPRAPEGMAERFGPRPPRPRRLHRRCALGGRLDRRSDDRAAPGREPAGRPGVRSTART